jgi:membrane protease subunit HflC
MRKLLFILVIILLLVILRLSFFTVEPTEFVYLTQLGRHVATYDGEDAQSDAGFHWCYPWPVNSVQRLDRRLQMFDLLSQELVTNDPKTERMENMLIVEGYVCWRIAGKEAVDLFIRRLGTPQRAEKVLGDRINSHLRDTIQQLSTSDLVNTDPTVVQKTTEKLASDVTEKLRPQIEREYGVQLVDVRLRRFSYSPSIRTSIFERIKSEREKKADEYRSAGDRKAKDIRTKAEEKRRTLLAEARRQEEILKGKADTEAAMIRNQAHSKDPEFYVFLKKLENLQNILGDNKTVLLLSSHREIFEMLFQPPQGPGLNGRPPGMSATKSNEKGGNGEPKGH